MKMKIRLNCDAKVVPYLHEKVIQDFSNITIISEDKEHYQINPILLLSWIRIGGVYQLAKDEKTCSNPIIKVLDEHLKWYIQEKSRLSVIVVVLLVIVKIFEHIREVLMRVLNDHLETEIEP